MTASGGVERIVETKYPEGVPPEELAIREINLGTYAFGRAGRCSRRSTRSGREDGERYLTDVVPAPARERRARSATHPTDDVDSAIGVNDRADLTAAEEIAQGRMLGANSPASGVTFVRPRRRGSRPGVEIGADTTIGPGSA